MYASLPLAVPSDPSPAAPYTPGDRAELIARLEAERLPNGFAFAAHPDSPAFDDSLAAIVERRRQLVAAFDESSPAVDRRSARLRVVA
jgi:hypothetical protein